MQYPSCPPAGKAKIKLAVLCVTVSAIGVASSILSAADVAYIGKWKLNQVKSQLTGETSLIEKTPDGGVHLHQNDLDFIFKLDGKEYPLPTGGTIAVKVADANTWDMVVKVNNKVTSTQHLSVSGNTFSATAQRVKPDGGTMQTTLVFKRVSGGPGFAGKWKTTEVKASGTLELQANGPEGLTLKFPDDGDLCEAKFDGKDYPVTGPAAGGKTTLSLKKLSPSSFEVTEKRNGKADYLDKYTVSGDGKTLTDEGTPFSKKEITKAVYDRQ